MNPYLVILLYFSSWVLLFVLYYYKHRIIGIPGTIIIIYAFSAFTSIFFYQNNGDVYNIKLDPFIFLYCCMVVCLYPLLKNPEVLSNIRLKKYQDKSGLIKKVLLVFFPFVVITLFELVVIANSTNSNGLNEIYESEVNLTSEQLSWISKKVLYIISFFAYMWPVLFFYCLIRGDEYKKLSYVALLAYFCLILEGYTNAHRVVIVRLIIYLFVVFYFFRHDLTKNFKRKFYIISLSVISLSTLLLFIITLSRFDNISANIDLKTWLSLYTGEGALRFSEYVWDLNKISYGDTNFCFIKNTLGLDTFVSLQERRDFYAAKFNIPTSIFYTYIGDICIDFGKYLTVIYSLLSSFLLSILLKTNKHPLTFFKLSVLSLVIYIYIFGFMYCSFKVYSEQLRIIICLTIFYLYNRIETKKI